MSLEPQMAALASEQASLERLSTMPRPPQYDYFTRILVLAYAALIPLSLLSLLRLLPDWPWLVLPLAMVLAGVFVVRDVVGAADDEPMAGGVTDVPVHAFCRGDRRGRQRRRPGSATSLQPGPHKRRRLPEVPVHPPSGSTLPRIHLRPDPTGTGEATP